MKKFLALLLFAGFSIDSGVAQTEDQLLKRFVPIFPETAGWDNFVDAFTPKDRTWGIGYGYSQSFPLTLAGNFTISCFSNLYFWLRLMKLFIDVLLLSKITEM